jgi:hypothetical protein
MRLLRPARPSLRFHVCLLALLVTGAAPAVAHAQTGQTVVADDFTARSATVVHDVPRTGARISASQIDPEGPRALAVLLVNFASAPSEPVSVERTREVVFTAPDSVNAYYREQSFGRVWFTADVFGWLTIDAPTTGCPYRDWSAAARATAGGRGIDLADYDHLVYVFPYMSACGWGGLGELPGDESWVNGAPTLRVIGHELGHNLGAHHANALRCTDGVGQGLSLAEEAACEQTEYGDPFSIMGGSASRHLNGWHKAHLGWIDGSGIRSITSTGDYTLSPVGFIGPGAQLLRISREDGTYLYVDFRRPFRTYFETFPLGSPAIGGVSVRIAPDLGSYVQSALVDAHPKTHSLDDAPLLPGEQLTDPVTGVTIATAAVTPWYATVRVTWPGRPGSADAPAADDSSPPTAPTGLAADGATVSWTASGDDVGVAGYWVLRDGSVVGSPLGTSFADETAVPERTYAYSVLAYDSAGNVGPESSALTVTMPARAPSTTPPAVAAPALPTLPAVPSPPPAVSRNDLALLAAPRIVGRARLGARLVARPARWSDAAPMRSWRWLRCRPQRGACTVIAGARQAKYRVTRKDVGFVLRVVETAAAGGLRATAASRLTARVERR